MLTEMTDILDHLEASGNVPAGYERYGAKGHWVFRGWAIERLGDDITLGQLARVALCHTIEGVLVKAHWSFDTVADAYRWKRADHNWVRSNLNRLSAAAAAYRAHFNLEATHADS